MYIYMYVSECICRDESRNGAYPEVSWARLSQSHHGGDFPWISIVMGVPP